MTILVYVKETEPYLKARVPTGRPEVGRTEAGASLVEFSLIMPLLLLLLLGIVDLSIWLSEHARVNAVAYEGARYASSMIGLSSEEEGGDQGKLTGIQLRVLKLLKNYNPDMQSASIQVHYTGQDNDNLVTVAIQVPYEPQFSFWGEGLSVNVLVQAPYLYPEE